MNVHVRNCALLLCTWLLLAGACFGKQVHLQDGGVITAESYWQRGEKVFVKINRDTVAEFDQSEVDLKQTADDPANKVTRAKRQATAKETKPAAISRKAANVQPVAAAAATPQPASATAAKTVPKPAAAPAPAPIASTSPEPPAAPAPDAAANMTEQQQKAQEAAAMMADAIKNKDPELLKKAMEAQQSAMPPEQAAQAKSLGTTYLILLLVISLLLIVSMWVVFEKAGEAGWKSIVPIYNLYVLMLVCGKPGWWFLLMFIPIIGAIFYLLAMLSLSARFGRGAVFGIGLFFLPMIFFPLLAFGSGATAEA